MTITHVKGLANIQNFLDQLPAKMEANVVRGGLRKGIKEFEETAKQNCPTGEPSETNKIKYKLYAGALRDSIRVSSKIDKRNGQVVAKLTAGGKSKKTGASVFYAHMIEFGVRPHSNTKRGKGEQNHPGISPRPFMRPAFDSRSTNAVVAAAEYMKKRLSTKNGLDTADIQIEVLEE